MKWTAFADQPPEPCVEFLIYWPDSDSIREGWMELNNDRVFIPESEWPPVSKLVQEGAFWVYTKDIPRPGKES